MRLLTRDPAKAAKWFFTALFALNFAWAMSYFFAFYNPILFDHGGHLASGGQLFRNGLHHFNDQMFLGNTQNLFYPPLQDFILGLASKLGFQPEAVYPWYIVALLFGFLASLVGVLWAYRTVLGVVFFGTAALMLFNLDKMIVMKVQGWSFFDLYVVGLSTQFLSGIGFFALCRMWVKPEVYRRKWALFWAVSSLLSHIVVGLISVGILGVLSYRQNRLSKAASDVIIAIGACSFYFIPFFWYGKYLNSSSIYFIHTWYLFGLMAAAAMLSRPRWRESGGFYLICLFLYGCLTVLAAWDMRYNFNIPFHFYRLAIISYFLFSVTIAEGVDAFSASGGRRWLLSALNVGFLSYFLVFSKFWFPQAPGFTARPAPIQIDDSGANYLPADPYGRYFVLGDIRAPDTGLDSLLMARHPEFRSSKGLFWESAYANPLHSSYLVSMFSPPVVLDYLFDPDFLNCEYLRRLTDQYFWLFNIKGMIASDTDFNYLPPPKKDCWRTILSNGTVRFHLAKRGEIRFGGKIKNVYQLDFRPPYAWVSGVTNNLVEVISRDQIQFLPASGKFPYFGGAAVHRFQAAKSTRAPDATLFALPEDRQVFDRLAAAEEGDRMRDAAPVVPALKLPDGTLQIDLPAEPTWFFLKWSPQPGTVLTDSIGHPLEFVRAVPGIIGRAQGRIHVTVQRTPLMKFSYGISLIFLFAFCIRDGLWRRKDDGRATQPRDIMEIEGNV